MTKSAGRPCPVRRCGFIRRAKGSEKEKTCNHCGYRLFFGAVTQIRTGDLILTKDALYRLSYNSIIHAPDEGGMVATEKGLEPSTSSVTG